MPAKIFFFFLPDPLRQQSRLLRLFLWFFVSLYSPLVSLFNKYIPCRFASVEHGLCRNVVRTKKGHTRAEPSVCVIDVLVTFDVFYGPS